MHHNRVYVSLDIGTTSIKVVVAEYVKGQLNVLGVGTEKTNGLSRGVIVDIDDTVTAIKEAVKIAEQKSGTTIKDVVVGIPSNQIQIEPCHGMIAVASDNREITDKDVYNVIAAAKVRSVAPERDIISVLPEEFIVDGFDGIKDPRGMIGVRLELHANMITGPRTIIHNIKRCVQKAGLNLIDLVVQPIASAQVALTDGEREFGTILLDMGGGQTSVSIFHENQLKFSFVDQEGGEFVTRDISIILNTSQKSAEQLKREYGYAIASHTSDQEFFSVETIGKKEPVKVDEHYLAEIIEARLLQTFQTLKRALAEVDGLRLPGGIVITGGAASLPGAVELAEEVFEVPVKPFMPDQMGLRHPSYTTSLGLVTYACQLDDIHRIAQQSEAPHPITEKGAPMNQSSSSESFRNLNTDDLANSKETASNPQKQTAQKARPKAKHTTTKPNNPNGFWARIKAFFKSLMEE